MPLGVLLVKVLYKLRFFFIFFLFIYFIFFFFLFIYFFFFFDEFLIESVISMLLAL